MSLFDTLPWIHVPHPENYDGFKNICLIEWDIYVDSQNNAERIQTIAVINNISLRSKMLNGKKKGNTGYVSFIDMDVISKETSLRIINGYDQSMPVTIWCAIKGIDIPERAFKEIAFKSIYRVTGPMHYFNFASTVKKYKVKKRTSGRVVVPYRRRVRR